MQHTTKRLLRIFTPFMLLLLGLVLYYAMAGTGPEELGLRLTPAPEPTAIDSSAGVGVSTAAPLTSDPVATLTPAPTAVPTAVLPAGDLVSLAGPPAESIFPSTTTISFYWTSAYEPVDGQVYGVFIKSATSEVLAGTVESANFGRQFQLQVRPADLTLAPGDYEWDVRLLQEGSTAARWQSAPRYFTIEEVAPAN